MNILCMSVYVLGVVGGVKVCVITYLNVSESKRKF